VHSIAVIGAGGRLGAALVRAYSKDSAVTAFSHAQLDVGDFEQVRRTLRDAEFDVLINCAAQTNVDRCETEQEEAFRLNGEAAGVIAEICSARGAKLIHIGTDYVFDGAATEPYRETDEPRPISVYGASKLEGDRRVLETDAMHVVARVSWVFGPDRPSFVDALIKRARTEEHLDAIGDKWSTPSYTIDLAAMLRPLFKPEATGIFHVTNGGACTWQEYAQWAIDCCVKQGVPLKGRTVAALKLADMKNFIARRPPYTVLSTERFRTVTGVTPRHWRDAVGDYVRSYVGK
jgi:dTDP-4-dehydrorhamnose reductase